MKTNLYSKKNKGLNNSGFGNFYYPKSYPITFETILFGIFVPLLLIILFLTVYLETIITQEGIYVHFFP